MRSTTPSGSQNATSIAKRMPRGVHVAARAQHERALERVAPEQPAPTGARGVGHLGCCQHVTVADEPGHRSALRHTLKRISSTSPSTTS